MPFVKATTKSLAYRFWSRVDKRDENECWPWTGRPDSDGYGHLKMQGKAKPAHRVSFIMHGGTIPPGQVIRHTCDNPCCVNPAHLLPGTNQDNIRDRVQRNRSASGDRNGSRLHLDRRPRGSRHHWQTKPWTRMNGVRNGRAKLNAEQVEEIRRRIATGEQIESIGRAFGVSGTAIRLIKTGKNWGKVGAQ